MTEPLEQKTEQTPTPIPPQNQIIQHIYMAVMMVCGCVGAKYIIPGEKGYLEFFLFAFLFALAAGIILGVGTFLIKKMINKE